MTIKVEAWQRGGIATDHYVEKFEFCCWDSLFRWLKGYTLHKCPTCKEMKIS